MVFAPKPKQTLKTEMDIYYVKKRNETLPHL